jgi:hypothetical protein
VNAILNGKTVEIEPIIFLNEGEEFALTLMASMAYST